MLVLLHFLHFLAGGPSNERLAPLTQPFFVFCWLAIDQMAGAFFVHFWAGGRSQERSALLAQLLFFWLAIDQKAGADSFLLFLAGSRSDNRHLLRRFFSFYFFRSIEHTDWHSGAASLFFCFGLADRSKGTS